MTGKVGLLVPCLADLFAPATLRATVRLLEHLGLPVWVPKRQTCCGQPGLSAGYWEEARPVAAHTLALFADCEAVVAPGGSCVAAIRHFLPQLGFPPSQCGRFYELSEFLVQVLGRADLGGRLELRVAYHPACHTLRLLGLRTEPLILLRNVAGLEVVELDDRDACCGFGGVFSALFPEVAGAMGAAKAEAVTATGAPYVTSTDTSCLLQIAGVLQRQGSPVRTLHLAEVLAWSLGLMKPPGHA